MAYVPCYNCRFMGNHGKTPYGDLIAWCLLQHVIVGPEIGCANNQPIQEERNGLKAGDYVENREGTVGGVIQRFDDNGIVVFKDEHEIWYRMKYTSIVKKGENDG